MKTDELISGSCHCGNIRYEFYSTVPRQELSVRACQCSFCKKRNAQYTSDPNGKLKIHLQEEQLINKYRFSTKTADFWICKNCGLLPVVTTQIGDTMYAVVNLTTTDNIDISQSAAKPADSSSEDRASREKRRKKTWISDVTVLQRGLTQGSSFFPTEREHQ